jgi:hypothetical protein
MFRRMTRVVLHILHLDFSRRAVSEISGASRENARRTASRYARGSVALQSDSFITRTDLEREREQVKKYKFAI